MVLIDTGSFNTVVHEKTALANNWRIRPCVQLLEGPGGEPLICVGTTRQKIELTLGIYTKSIDYTISVDYDLTDTAILGLDFMAVLKVVIFTSARRLIFQPKPNKPGVWLS